jgi:glycerol uptake facilitator-like aquaporin
MSINTDSFNHTHSERDWKWWCRRVLIGQTETDYKNSKRNSKPFKVYRWLQKEMRRYAAEFVGSYFLILFIAGIAVLDGEANASDNASDVSLTTKGLIGGFTLAGLIYCFGQISGAHFNPCVTFAFFCRGLFNFFRMIMYWIFQFAGGILAAGTLRWMFGK